MHGQCHGIWFFSHQTNSPCPIGHAFGCFFFSHTLAVIHIRNQFSLSSGHFFRHEAQEIK
jgi:hypothetical protein